MNIKQNNTLLQAQKNFFSVRIVVGLFLLLLQINIGWADGLMIKALNFSTLSGDKVQLQLEMDGQAFEPKIFQTDNPARIALDFADVKNGLSKKSFAVNKGAATSVYVVEAEGRTRVVINLVQTVPYQTSIDGNKIFITLNEATLPVVKDKQIDKVEAASNEPQAVTEKIEPAKIKKQSVVARLLPKQTIKDIDFRRGATGNGLVLIALAKPNTVIDVKESGGKVVLKFLNTTLPEIFKKRFDVSDFATPVQKIDVVNVGTDTIMTISTADGNYEYSSYQANGLLTVDFKPLTQAEKEEAAKKKFPYSGNKLSLNFQDIPVRDVLQVLADFTEFNMITTDAVGGNITLRLNDVPWDQALDLILKSKGLGQRKAGNVVWIAPMEEITKLEKSEEESQKVSVRLEPLRTEYIQINYAKAEDIKLMLMGQGTSSTGKSTSTSVTVNPNNPNELETGKLLSARGIANVDPRTNTLIVKDTVKQLDEIRGLIKLLDIPVRQVMIETRIVSATKNFAQALGVRFGVNQTAAAGSGKVFAVGPSGTVSGIPTYSTGDTATQTGGGTFVPAIKDATTAAGGYLFDLAAKGTGVGALAMTLARGADYVLNLELSALENENRGEVLANPRVMTSDRVKATVMDGTQIPYTTSTATQIQTTFKNAVLKLEVTPQITPNGSVIMELDISNNSPGTAAYVGGPLPITTKELQTTVQVNDGETVVLGGTFLQDLTHNTNRIPFFSDLPGIGFLFKNKSDNDNKRELLIFVTPKIVKESLSIH